jgi:trans-aconitate 2-methyltransferase
MLLERLPRGHVIAADRSPSMLEQARATLAAYADRVSYLQTDLTEIDRVLEPRVDVVFSTAVFHWIPDHVKLFAALRAIVRPGAWLVAQCGGGSNLARLMQATDSVAQGAAFRAHLEGRELWRAYYFPAETTARLQQAGFEEARVWLEDSPQDFDDAEAFAEFSKTVVLSRHVAALPPALVDDFVNKVVDSVKKREGAFRLDYVRLNIDARPDQRDRRA